MKESEIEFKDEKGEELFAEFVCFKDNLFQRLEH